MLNFTKYLTLQKNAAAKDSDCDFRDMLKHKEKAKRQHDKDEMEKVNLKHRGP